MTKWEVIDLPKDAKLLGIKIDLDQNIAMVEVEKIDLVVSFRCRMRCIG